MEKKKFKLNMHLVLALVIIVILFLIVRKFWGFFRYITQEEIDAISVPEDAQMQDLDYIIPLEAEDDGTFPEDDGVLTVLCLGNGAFADDKSSPDNPCNLFAQSTGATVYNCTIAGSCLSAANPTFDASDEPMDAFSLFWLTSIFILKRQELVSDAYAALGDVPADIKESINTLQNLDLRTVDMVYIMFDGSDFLAGRSPAADSANPSDLQTFGAPCLPVSRSFRNTCPGPALSSCPPPTPTAWRKTAATSAATAKFTEPTSFPILPLKNIISPKPWIFPL